MARRCARLSRTGASARRPVGVVPPRSAPGDGNGREGAGAAGGRAVSGYSAAVEERIVLFDLDGTLVDGGAAMLACLAEACRAVGVAVPPEESLRRFIGPPLERTFAERFGLDEASCARAVAAYRTGYVAGGAVDAAVLYPGIADLLERLGRQGVRCAVATSKPTPQAERILANLGVRRHFAGVFGADPAGRRAAKEEVVADACVALGLDADRAVMVGDTVYDVHGAAAHGIGCIGVLWGFGTRDELEQAGALAVASHPIEVGDLLGA